MFNALAAKSLSLALAAAVLVPLAATSAAAGPKQTIYGTQSDRGGCSKLHLRNRGILVARARKMCVDQTGLYRTNVLTRSNYDGRGCTTQKQGFKRFSTVRGSFSFRCR
ncbi:MAG: hypothetical protein AAF318_03455 [Pseudomonadota bacterium]